MDRYLRNLIIIVRLVLVLLSCLTFICIKTNDTLAEGINKKSIPQQKVFQAYEKSLYGIDAPATEALEKFFEVYDSFKLKGKEENDELFQAAKIAQVVCKQVSQAYLKHQIPNTLPEELRVVLKEAQNDFSKAYTIRAKAMESIFAYLNNPKLVYLDDHEQEFEKSGAFLLSGILKIMDVKTKLGLDQLSIQN